MGFRSSDTFLAWMTIALVVSIFTVPKSFQKTVGYSPPDWIGVAEGLAARVEAEGPSSIKDPPVCEKNGEPFTVISNDSYWNVCCITESNKNPAVPRCRGPEGWIGPTVGGDAMTAGNWDAEYQENGDLLIQYHYRSWTRYIYYLFGALFLFLIPYSIWDGEYFAALICPLCIAMIALYLFTGPSIRIETDGTIKKGFFSEGEARGKLVSVWGKKGKIKVVYKEDDGELKGFKFRMEKGLEGDFAAFMRSSYLDRGAGGGPRDRKQPAPQ